MKYFHRTSLEAEAVLSAADDFFPGHVAESGRESRGRTYLGTIGSIAITVRPDGGHYTFVTARTDQVGESEADKLVKRFLGTVHTRVEPTHRLRGAY
jgi:hypothetical protein